MACPVQCNRLAYTLNLPPARRQQAERLLGTLPLAMLSRTFPSQQFDDAC
jgi:hypothetical protein